MKKSVIVQNLSLTRKMTICLLALLVLVGCSPKKADDNQLISKIDDTKDYVYISESSSYDIKTILNEVNRLDDYALIVEIDNPITELSLDSSHKLVNELMVINIDSEDADSVNQLLKDDFARIENLRKENAELISNGEYSFSWETRVLVSSNESDEILSVISLNQKIRFGSESFSNVEIYNFDLKSGKLLSDDELLTKVGKGMTLSELKEVIKDKATTDDRLLMSEHGSVEYIDNEEEALIRANASQAITVIRLKDTHAIFMYQDTLYVSIQQLLLMDKSFVDILQISLPIDELS